MLKPETKAVDVRGTLNDDDEDWNILTKDNERIWIDDLLRHFEGKVVRFKISDDEWQ